MSCFVCQDIVGVNSRQKKAANLAALREGYKTLISRKEVCISRVADRVTKKANGWNVAYCRVTDCRRAGQHKNSRQKNAADKAAHLREGYKTLISEEEVCISRVAAIVTAMANGWNVAYCRATNCRRAG